MRNCRRTDGSRESSHRIEIDRRAVRQTRGAGPRTRYGHRRLFQGPGHSSGAVVHDACVCPKAEHCPTWPPEMCSGLHDLPPQMPVQARPRRGNRAGRARTKIRSRHAALSKRSAAQGEIDAEAVTQVRRPRGTRDRGGEHEHDAEPRAISMRRSPRRRSAFAMDVVGQ